MQRFHRVKVGCIALGSLIFGASVEGKIVGRTLAALVLIVLAVSSKARAELRFANALSDHAVLQRGVPISIWGWSDPGAVIIVSMHSQQARATASPIGQWTATLMPEAAGGPYTIEARADNGSGRAAISDVLVGDVWLASGQSNMEMPLEGWPGMNAKVKNSEMEIKDADQPRIRLLMVEKTSSPFPLNDIKTTWRICTPESARSFSAVAYFFGRDMLQDQNVPIGLIGSSWGGTPVDSWISLDGLASSAMLAQVSVRNRAHLDADLANRDLLNARFMHEAQQAKQKGKPAPTRGWVPESAAYMPAALYNGMIAPLHQYAIKGFLWYQGESDTTEDRAAYYASAFQLMIQDWRRHFQQGDLPFLFVQISSFDWQQSWGQVRDAQRQALALRNTAMAVTLDLGDRANIHPPDKQAVSARLAAAAQGMVFGKPVEYESPLYRQATREPGSLRIWFDYGRDLVSHGKPLDGFEVAGEDRRFVPATAIIEGQTVLLHSDAVPEPLFARYAYQPVAPSSLLYNSAGLPASTFTTDTEDHGAR